MGTRAYPGGGEVAFEAEVQIPDPANVRVVDPVGQKPMAASVSVAIASDQTKLPAVLYDVLGNAVGVVLDGAIYRLQVAAKLDAGTNVVGFVGIDPANTGGLALEATLSDIRDAAGIKKITDALPVGDNAIGRTKIIDAVGNIIDSVLDGLVRRFATATIVEKWLGSSAPTVGQKAMVDSLPVVVASDQTKLPTVLYDTLGNAVGVVLDGAVYRLQTATKIESWFGSTAPTVGQKTAANSIPVVLPSDQTVTATPDTSATSTTTSVAASAVSVTLLAANAARKGATIYNDSTKKLYLKLGAAASLTSYTDQLFPDAYYEVPFSYTGAITGLWSAASGDARITELT